MATSSSPKTVYTAAVHDITLIIAAAEDLQSLSGAFPKTYWNDDSTKQHGTSGNSPGQPRAGGGSEDDRLGERDQLNELRL
ncbi:MAG: hypothetical protein Q9176_002014 [Flavoplaca citrina]